MLGFDIPHYLIYIIIFAGKMLEVSFGTLRIMFSGKGKKLLSAGCALVEIFLWVIIASSVLTDLNEDPLKMVVYCVAFACGVPIGIHLEGKLAVGLTSIQIVSLADRGECVACALRMNNFGVTILEGHSVDGTARNMVFVQLRRKRIPEAMAIVRKEDPDAIISVNDVKSLSGGFLK